MLQRYFIQISFDGTRYSGWQIQPNANTVQQALNTALQLILSEPISTIGCGRTDAGVHAQLFYAHFDCAPIVSKTEIITKLNNVLPLDIVVNELYLVKNDCNSRFDATSRVYKYYILLKKDAFLYHRTWYRKEQYNIELMQQACKILFEYQDFSCFSKSNTQVFTNNCTIIQAHWEQNLSTLVFTIEANRFLRNMVRAIVGTLLDIGKEKISLEDFKNIIESKKRSNAGVSVPAKALFLHQVKYPENYFDNTINN
jgi:tRNA pseudouridine38-40 synthase